MAKKLPKKNYQELIDQNLILKSLGIRQVRVRTHQEIARIEVEPQDMQLVLMHHHQIIENLQAFGYKYITLDLQGYMSGSMNKVLQQV